MAKVTIQSLTRGFLVTADVWPNDPAHGLYAEADARAALHRAAEFLGIEPASLYAPAIAIADGFPATGGGLATHHVEPAPELPPAAAALIELGDEDAPTAHLKAGEATNG